MALDFRLINFLYPVIAPDLTEPCCGILVVGKYHDAGGFSVQAMNQINLRQPAQLFDLILHAAEVAIGSTLGYDICWLVPDAPMARGFYGHRSGGSVLIEAIIV